MSDGRPAKVSREIIERYRFIRAVHTCLYTQLDMDVTKFGPEFFFLVGDVLEGKPIDGAGLRFIDINRVRDFLKEDK